MDNKQIIQDFIDSTPQWLEQMSRMKQDSGCMVCGLRPSNIKKLREAIIELQQSK